MRNIFLSCTPTRFLPTTGAPPAYANPRLKSAPHDLDACCSIAMHTASAALSGPTRVTYFPFRAQSAASAHPEQLSIPILLPH